MTDDHIADLEARVQALSRAREHIDSRLNALERDHDRLRERLTTLESLVAPDPEATTYDQLTRAQRVRRVRQALVRTAADRPTGKAKLEYDEVQWLFDDIPLLHSDGGLRNRFSKSSKVVLPRVTRECYQ